MTRRKWNRCWSTATAAIGFATGFAMVSTVSGCEHRQDVDTAVPGVQARAPLDSARGEVREPHEDERTEEILRAVKARLIRDYPPDRTPRMPRDAHQKMHGCTVGTFAVNDDIAPEYRVGLFSTPGQTYPAVTRFSNSDAKPQPDKKPDARGMALKLLNVAGPKLIADEVDAQTHDFMLLSGSVFFVRNLDEYVGVLRALESGDVARDTWFATHPHARNTLLPVFNQRIQNPVQQTYFSATPYRFGARAAKYRVRPCEPVPAPIPPTSPTPGFLQDALKATLQTEAVCYRFSVQLQTNPQTQPVEDSTVRWDEAEAPFVDVATLTMPIQDVDTPSRRIACENMSFTPWHALEVHRPLGSVNRARLRVYELISRYRNQHNSVAHQEPTDLGALEN